MQYLINRRKRREILCRSSLRRKFFPSGTETLYQLISLDLSQSLKRIGRRGRKGHVGGRERYKIYRSFDMLLLADASRACATIGNGGFHLSENVSPLT